MHQTGLPRNPPAPGASSLNGSVRPSSTPDAGARTRSYTWDDPAVSAAAAREQDGTAFLQAILDGTLPGAPIARTLDFAPVSVEPGTVVFEFTPAEFHYNPIGSVHGGVISTLCDSACGCAVQSLLPAGTYYTSLDLSVKFLRAVSSGTGPLTCTGTVTHLGGRSALAEARLASSDGKLYAFATSSCMIFRPAAG
ncbi:MAG TPA: PaaI family thioesterase [Streptosporangiaceae bacterium]|nr:PaaI family thioesterase [Streptosporangiaceae bacterium]